MAKLYLGSNLISGGASTPPDIDKTTGVYTQSTVYPGNAEAAMAAFTSETIISSTQTATNSGTNQFVRVDYGSVQPIKKIMYRGPDGTNPSGGWSAIYLAGTDIQISEDDSIWTTVATVQTSGAGFSSTLTADNYISIQSPGSWKELVLFSGLTARYIRAFRAAHGFVALSGLYAV